MTAVGYYLDLVEKLVKNGGLYINSVRVGSTDEMVYPDHHLLSGNLTVLRVGKFFSN